METPEQRRLRLLGLQPSPRGDGRDGGPGLRPPSSALSKRDAVWEERRRARRGVHGDSGVRGGHDHDVHADGRYDSPWSPRSPRYGEEHAPGAAAGQQEHPPRPFSEWSISESDLHRGPSPVDAEPRQAGQARKADYGAELRAQAEARKVEHPDKEPCVHRASVRLMSAMFCVCVCVCCRWMSRQRMPSNAPLPRRPPVAPPG